MAVPWLQDADLTLYQGDALSVLRELPSESVHTCITSPPFYGLRSYLPDGHEDKGLEIGLESSPEQWVENLVAIFHEVRRVLRDDGTFWLEVGDSYNSRPGGPQGESGDRASRTYTANTRAFRPGSGRADGIVDERSQRNRDGIAAPGMKPKDLIGAPWMLAFALRADGWWLRQANIWWHTNCLPESVTDRPTSAHSYVFLLTKKARYFYDAEAVKEPAAWDRWGGQTPQKTNDASARGAHFIKERSRQQVMEIAGLRNLRSVWPIPTQGFSEAHFATMPEAVIRPCILAGTSAKGACPHCGAPWARETETSYDSEGRTTNGPRSTEQRHETAGFAQRLVKQTETLGWLPSCDCFGDGRDGTYVVGPPPVPCTVLDPFFGSGTSGLVARKHGRHTIGIELSEEYCVLAAKRLQQLSLLTEL